MCTHIVTKHCKLTVASAINLRPEITANSYRYKINGLVYTLGKKVRCEDKDRAAVSKLLRRIIRALTDPKPENIPCVTKIIATVEDALLRSLSGKDIVSHVFYMMREVPKSIRSPKYMMFDEQFLQSGVTPLAYMSDLDDDSDDDMI